MIISVLTQGTATAVGIVIGVLAVPLALSYGQTWDGTIVQYGTMHEAIGQRQYQGRVQLSEPIQRSHFFGLGALARLEGEITIADGHVTVTEVDAAGRLRSSHDAALDKRATILAGAYVSVWTEQIVAANLAANKYDEFIESAAATAGINTSAPFVFTVEGEFNGLKLHVINGACPVHAQRNNIHIPVQHQPYETVLNHIRGKLVGIFAKNAAGNLTHPDLSTHTHVVFDNELSGEIMTGHVERVELAADAVLRLPKVNADRTGSTP